MKQQFDLIQEKFTTTELTLENLKKQNLAYHIDIKSKDDRLVASEKQIEEQKVKLKLHKDELDRFEEEIKGNSSDVAHLNNLREDLEHKV